VAARERALWAEVCRLFDAGQVEEAKHLADKPVISEAIEAGEGGEAGEEKGT